MVTRQESLIAALALLSFSAPVSADGTCLPVLAQS